MARTTAQLRELLMDSIDGVRNKTLTPDQAKAVAMLAGQVNMSLQVEANLRLHRLNAGKPLGQLTVSGDAPDAADPLPAEAEQPRPETPPRLPDNRVHLIADDQPRQAPRDMNQPGRRVSSVFELGAP